MARERRDSERENENAANASAKWRQMPVLEGHACGQKSEEMQKASSEGESSLYVFVDFLLNLFIRNDEH